MHAIALARISPRSRRGSTATELISLDDALSAGGLQAAAELRRLVDRGEGAHHRAVIDSFVAKVRAPDGRLTVAEKTWEFRLQAAERSLRVVLTALRGYLHERTRRAIVGRRCRQACR